MQGLSFSSVPETFSHMAQAPCRWAGCKMSRLSRPGGKMAVGACHDAEGRCHKPDGTRPRTRWRVIFLAATAPNRGNGWPWLETVQNGLFGAGDRDGGGMVSHEEAFFYAWDLAVQFGLGRMHDFR